MLKYAGKDGTKEFNNLHNVNEVLKKYGEQLYVGDLEGATPANVPFPTGKNTGTAPNERVLRFFFNVVSGVRQTVISYLKMLLENLCLMATLLGTKTGRGFFIFFFLFSSSSSPFYNESHRRWRAALRDFVDKEITPYCHEWDEQKKVDPQIFVKMADAGILPGFSISLRCFLNSFIAVVGTPWPTEYVGTKIAGGVKPEVFSILYSYLLGIRPIP